jgi:hypothetical protein
MAKFSQEELQRLLNSVLAAGVHAMRAEENSPKETADEVEALFKSLDRYNSQSESEVVNDIVQLASETYDNKNNPAPDASLTYGAAFDRQPELFQSIRESVALVKSKAGDDEALEYRRLVYYAAEMVAMENKEGGVLDIVRKRISDNEREVLDKLRALLEL